MKKNIVFIATSIDGYIADKNGSIDWLESIPNPEGNDMGFGAVMEKVDAVVMGRTTYEKVLSFGIEWPYSKHVYVLSTSIKDVPVDLSSKVSILQGTPADILMDINHKGHHKLYIDGGRTVQDFLKADLIDELIITTLPLLLGGGFPLFGELPSRQSYLLVESKVFLNTIVQNRYKRNNTVTV